MKNIQEVIDSGLCLGCGLCKTIIGQNCSMLLNDKGFYVPIIHQPISVQNNRILMDICPSINVKGKSNKGVWGKIDKIYDGWSKDPEVRYRSSSGGVISALSIYLVEKKIVDGILHVGNTDENLLENRLKISENRADIISNCSSRYAPALVFDHIKEILSEDSRTFAFIGKPCDIAGLKNYFKIFPEKSKKIKFYLSIFCAGMPSINGTHQILAQSKKSNKTISKIKYRGEGWPGTFEATYDDGSNFTMNYNDSWSKNLSKHVGIRCRMCPDGIGMLADIAVGDSWESEDGYPSFEEKDGRSFVLIRNKKGQKLFENASHSSYIGVEKLGVEKLKSIQGYQYRRRIFSPFRILAAQIHYGFTFNFSGIGIYSMILKANPLIGVKNFYGTFKRIKRITNVKTNKRIHL